MSHGFVIEHLKSVDSTQAEARRRLAAGNAATNLVLVADQQTAGRGRRGHTWHASEQHSLLFSVVLPPSGLQRPARLLLLIAVAVARALESCSSVPVFIKWPNDLFTNRAKLGGLIAENLCGAEKRAVLLGIGLNLSESSVPLPAEIEQRTAHAGLQPGFATRDRVLEALLGQLRQLLGELETPAEAAWGTEFQRRSWLDGREVEILQAGHWRAARIQSVSAKGDLLLDDGQLLRGEHVESVRAVDKPS